MVIAVFMDPRGKKICYVSSLYSSCANIVSRAQNISRHCASHQATITANLVTPTKIAVPVAL